MGKRTFILILAMIVFMSGIMLVMAETATQQVTVTVVPGFVNIYSPIERSYTSKMVPFNISIITNDEVEKIEYIDWSDDHPRWTLLCLRCNEYGFFSQKSKPITEGVKNWTIRATNKMGGSEEANVLFYVDSREPVIIEKHPRRNKVTNGSWFSVDYTEKNLQKIILFYGNSTLSLFSEKSDCPAGLDKDCEFLNLDVSMFDGQQIDYWFEVIDTAGNFANSRKIQVEADTSDPVINSVEYKLSGTLLRWATFKLNITEKNFVDVGYIETKGKSVKYRRLCAKLDNGLCEIKKYLGIGRHNLVISAKDSAGNSEKTQLILG